MKKIIQILFTVILWLSLFTTAYWWAINFNQHSWIDNIQKNSINSSNIGSWDIEDNIKWASKEIFKIAKTILWWLFVIMLVYAWAMMILSMWSNEDQLSNAKKSVWFAVVWLLFINIPWTLFDAFSWKKRDDITWALWDNTTEYSRNLFVNSDIFWSALWWIIDFLQIAIVSFAVLIVVLQWIKIMTARWKDEDISEAKNKIIYSVMWLIFIWIMEAWRYIMFTWDFKWAWAWLFWSLANLALYFAWPIAIFFLSLAWYYYITSNGDEDRVKKAKNIVINTLLATLILLAIFTFFNDLSSISFWWEYDDLVD